MDNTFQVNGITYKEGPTIDLLKPCLLARRRKDYSLRLSELVENSHSTNRVYALENSDYKLSRLRKILNYLNWLGVEVHVLNIPLAYIGDIMQIEWAPVRFEEGILTILRKHKRVSQRDAEGLMDLPTHFVKDMEISFLNKTFTDMMAILARYGFYVWLRFPEVKPEKQNPIVVSVTSKMREYELTVEDIAFKTDLSETAIRRFLRGGMVDIAEVYCITSALGFTLTLTED